MQTYVHDDERRQQTIKQDSDQFNAWSIQRRPKDKGGVSSTDWTHPLVIKINIYSILLLFIIIIIIIIILYLNLLLTRVSHNNLKSTHNEQ